MLDATGSTLELVLSTSMSSECVSVLTNQAIKHQKKVAGEKAAEEKAAKAKVRKAAEEKAWEDSLVHATGTPIPIKVEAASGQSFTINLAKTGHTVAAVKKMLARVSGLLDISQQLFAIEDKREIEDLELKNEESVLRVMEHCQYATTDANLEL
jgi:hypothetical protein